LGKGWSARRSVGRQQARSEVEAEEAEPGCDADDLGGLSGSAQRLTKRLEVRIVAADEFGDHKAGIALPYGVPISGRFAIRKS
jgi:hypothetical protein